MPFLVRSLSRLPVALLFVYLLFVVYIFKLLHSSLFTWMWMRWNACKTLYVLMNTEYWILNTSVHVQCMFMFKTNLEYLTISLQKQMNWRINSLEVIMLYAVVVFSFHFVRFHIFGFFLTAKCRNTKSLSFCFRFSSW